MNGTSSYVTMSQSLPQPGGMTHIETKLYWMEYLAVMSTAPVMIGICTPKVFHTWIKYWLKYTMHIEAH